MKILLALAAVASGCSAPTVTETNTPLVTRKIDDNSVAMTARATGTLTIEGGCIALEPGDAGDPMTVVWPDGTTVWNDELQTVTMTRRVGADVEASIGDFVELGGGQATAGPGVDYVVKPTGDCPSLLWIAS